MGAKICMYDAAAEIEKGSKVSTMQAAETGR
jgi:hypothetical protein